MNTIYEKLEVYRRQNQALKKNSSPEAYKIMIGKSILAVSLPIISFGTVNAQCQGSQANNLVLMENSANTGLSIDIDGDGTDDFKIYDNFGAAQEATLNIQALNGGAVLTSGGSGTVKNYGANDVINGTNTNQFNGQWFLVFASGGNVQGPWGPPYPTSGYIGVIQDGKYGFIQLTVSNGAANGSTGTDFTISVSEAGLSDTPGASIQASNCSTLPVELSSFKATASKESIHLAWLTSSEQNNAGFEVERSENGKNFKSLAFVEGNGNSLERRAYYFDDQSLRKSQLYYYRLKQIDFDGSYEYSEVISASIQGADKPIGTFAPNPVVSGLTQLQYYTPNAGELHLQVFDVAGKALWSQTQEVATGANSLTLDLSALASGTYFIKMEQEGSKTYDQIVID